MSYTQIANGYGHNHVLVYALYMDFWKLYCNLVVMNMKYVVKMVEIECIG